jgi:hypothetical protein
MKAVIFYTRKEDQDIEVGRVWNEAGTLKGTVQDVFLSDLVDWWIRSGEEIDEYLENLHKRFDGDFLYAGNYQHISDDKK